MFWSLESGVMVYASVYQYCKGKEIWNTFSVEIPFFQFLLLKVIFCFMENLKWKWWDPSFFFLCVEVLYWPYELCPRQQTKEGKMGWLNKKRTFNVYLRCFVFWAVALLILSKKRSYFDSCVTGSLVLGQSNSGKAYTHTNIHICGLLMLLFLVFCTRPYFNS